MPKWRIIIPVLIVAVIGVVAYLQLSSTAPQDLAPPAAEEPVDVADRPLGVTGNEDVGTQADALVDEMLRELDDEQDLAGDGTAEINAETAGESDIQILDVEYYEE